MPVSRLGDWLIDGFNAYSGRSTDPPSLMVGILALVALFIALALSAIGLWQYVLFVIVTLVVFLALYVAWRALVYAYRCVL